MRYELASGFPAADGGYSRTSTIVDYKVEFRERRNERRERIIRNRRRRESRLEQELLLLERRPFFAFVRDVVRKCDSSEKVKLRTPLIALRKRHERNQGEVRATKPPN